MIPIPIRDNIPSKNVPIINNVLIGINAVLFLLQWKMPDIERYFYIYGLVPARYNFLDWLIPARFYLTDLQLHLPDWVTNATTFQKTAALFSYMFLHGNFGHVLGNMWSLYIFGDNVEDHLGSVRYTLFYLLCGLISGLSHMALNYYSTAPIIGASGAVAGVMGAYFLLHPRSRILTLVPIVIIPWFIEIPAFFFLGAWLCIQIFYAYENSGAGSGIAWWAHIGGFFCGMLLLKLSDAMPSTGISAGLRKTTTRKKSFKFQIARPTQAKRNADMHATVTISRFEALVGTRKLVTVPYGLKRRMFRVNVPPGMEAGKLLRLKGQGQSLPDGSRGDLILKVIVQ